MKRYMIFGCALIAINNPTNAMQSIRNHYAAGICVAGAAAVAAPILYYIYKSYQAKQEKKHADTTDYPLSCVRGYPIPQHVRCVYINEDAIAKRGHKIITPTHARQCELLCKIQAHTFKDACSVTISSRHGTQCFEFCSELQNQADARVDYELLVPEGRTVVFQ